MTHRSQMLTRCLQLAWLAKDRPYSPDLLHELATYFGVSARTIRRDLAAIKAAGVPIPQPKGLPRASKLGY